MPSALAAYTYPIATLDTLVRGAAGSVRMAPELDGAPSAPTSGTCALISPVGATVATIVCTIVSGAAVAAFTAPDLPATLPYSANYQLRWSLVMADTTTREVRRQCALTPYDLPCPVGVDDLLAEYPILWSEFSDVEGTGRASLAAFIGESWRDILERMYADGLLPSRVVSVSALRKPVQQQALFLAFKALFRLTSGANRWDVLMSEHRQTAAAAWPPRVEVDLDDDGLADTPRQSSSSATVYPNVAGTTYLRHDSRW
jgi:hypothetical protein